MLQLEIRVRTPTFIYNKVSLKLYKYKRVQHIDINLATTYKQIMQTETPDAVQFDVTRVITSTFQ